MKLDTLVKVTNFESLPKKAVLEAIKAKEVFQGIFLF